MMITKLRLLRISELLFEILMLSWASTCKAHGALNDPPPRGCLAGSIWAPDVPPVDRSAPHDFRIHFPAGNRNGAPGSGHRSQMQAVPFWTEFTPLVPDFLWRSGVCGDERGPHQEHLKGGKYFYNGTISRTYVAGTSVEFKVSLAAHHNGYFEFHLCDVSKCNGDISENCFRLGACVQLQRANVKSCETGTSWKCGPIDRNHTGRWYLPCPHTFDGHSVQYFGRHGTIKYLIPENLVCSHCVLQWFYTSANSCNPPGVIEYFEGPDRPRNWGRCRGQAGSIGGYTKVQLPCGEKKFAEEYLNCADVRIIGKKTIKSNPIAHLELGDIENLEFKFLRKLYGNMTISSDRHTAFTVRAFMKWPVRSVQFFVTTNGRRVRVNKEKIAPYYISGMDNRRYPKPLRWKSYSRNIMMYVSVQSEGFETGAWLTVLESNSKN